MICKVQRFLRKKILDLHHPQSLYSFNILAIIILHTSYICFYTKDYITDSGYFTVVSRIMSLKV